MMCAPTALAAKPGPSAAIDAYVAPFVETNNFAGSILVARDETTIFARAYGGANREGRLPNKLKTRFHVASMSMQFTAAAALRLIDAEKLSLSTPVADVLPDYPNGRAITIGNLLTQTSGIADINAQEGYAEILTHHQTPLSLVERMRDVPALRQPGTYDREEHSAFNLLALIIERKTGLSFPDAVQRLVFKPIGMADSGIDDDRPEASLRAAKGYEPVSLYDLRPADTIHWSAKAGNGSAYTTVEDELKFVRAVTGSSFLSPKLRDTMFDLGARVGYGWFKSNNARFGEPVYYMNGRAPGFSSAVVYIPGRKLFVAALSNIYASVPTDVAYDIAALCLGLPYQPLALATNVDTGSLAGLPASFQFPKDFYQSNAIVRVAPADGRVILHWPSGDTSPLIPVTKDRYIDRSYWVAVEVQRDAGGAVTALKYDRFIGERTGN
jgi:CubicO group peptidase (beta-lactamase class C family)